MLLRFVTSAMACAALCAACGEAGAPLQLQLLADGTFSLSSGDSVRHSGACSRQEDARYLQALEAMLVELRKNSDALELSVDALAPMGHVEDILDLARKHAFRVHRVRTGEGTLLDLAND